MKEESISKTARFQAPDALRGLIIILMALDHANHFVAQKHSSGEYWGGDFPEYYGALSFLTRLVTHLSAPGFFFLMGMGMVLFTLSRRKRNWRESKIIQHFILRGSILILLQLFVVNRAWALSPRGWVLDTYIGVFFALGGTMIIGSFFLWLKPPYLLGLTAAFLLSDAYLPLDPTMWGNAFSIFSRLSSVPGGDLALWVNYPILPWLPLVSYGMLFGHWLAEDEKKSYQLALWIGVSFLAVFFILRAANGFGNIRPRAGESWIDFLTVVKYPPSLTFILLTMGSNLILLWGFSRIREKLAPALNMLIIFGQVPLLFYVGHLYLYAAMGNWLTPKGTSLPTMYLYWIVGLLILYPLCRWYAKLKRRQSIRSLLQFF